MHFLLCALALFFVPFRETKSSLFDRHAIRYSSIKHQR